MLEITRSSESLLEEGGGWQRKETAPPTETQTTHWLTSEGKSEGFWGGSFIVTVTLRTKCKWAISLSNHIHALTHMYDISLLTVHRLIFISYSSSLHNVNDLILTVFRPVHGNSTFLACFQLHSSHFFFSPPSHQQHVLSKFTQHSRAGVQQRAALKRIILAVKVFLGIINCA